MPIRVTDRGALAVWRAPSLEATEALPEQDSRCLSLRAEGLRYSEIAGVLDMSLGAVSMSLARFAGAHRPRRER
jgi:DNA-directed RNA polymerase specialized sigma24 family protein